MKDEVKLTVEEERKVMDQLNGKGLNIKFTSVTVGSKKAYCSRDGDEKWFVKRVGTAGRMN